MEFLELFLCAACSSLGFYFNLLLLLLFFLAYLGPHPRHMEVSRLGV